MLDLLTNEFAGLRRGRFTLSSVSPHAAQRFLFWHLIAPELQESEGFPFNFQHRPISLRERQAGTNRD
jgi:hypothetical protein